ERCCGTRARTSSAGPCSTGGCRRAASCGSAGGTSPRARWDSARCACWRAPRARWAGSGRSMKAAATVWPSSPTSARCPPRGPSEPPRPCFRLCNRAFCRCTIRPSPRQPHCRTRAGRRERAVRVAGAAAA
ncbi:unnamed protein product, partial [Prorocentrum cordatum]